jgi:ribosome-interacting GTPase 1
MTTNVSPEFLEAQRRFREAQTPEAKLEALKEMLSTIPKHKGTERMRVDLKQRYNKLQQEIERQQHTKKAGHASPYEHVEKHEAGQIVLAGLPNCGKSQFLAAVTAARPEIGDYPFTTFKPTVGMMPFEDIQIQLIDLPPLSEFTEGWVYGLIRQADAVALLADLANPDPETDTLEAMDLLEKARIRMVDRLPAESTGGTVRRALLVGTKSDAPGAGERFQALQNSYGSELPIVAISAQKGSGLDALKRALFDRLEIVRVYTKKPGEPPVRERPYTLPRGVTVLEVAKHVHYQLAEHLAFARLWGSAQYEGQRVERDHIVQDGDLLELHT